MLEINKIHQGDCLEKMKEMDVNSVDSIVTDPPYGLSFMGKKWDYDVPSVEIWKECLRVVKPGGFLLSFAGTRTQHRMAVNIEDAGFEIRDMIAWVYGVGFPKSHNIGKSVNQLETKEWLNISKAIDNFINTNNLINVCKKNLNNVQIVETQSLKNQTEAGMNIQKNDSVQENVVVNTNQRNLNLIASFVKKNLNEAQVTDTKISTVLQNVETEIKQLLNLVKHVEKLSQDQNHKSLNIFTAEENVKEWLKENIMVNHKVDEALKTLRGNQKYSNEEITSVLCVVIQNTLKLTILNLSKTFQNLDTKLQMECVSAINVTITEYIMEHLISNTVAILKSKAVDKLQGNERGIVEKKKQTGAKFKTVQEQMDNGGFNDPNRESFNITKGNSPYEGWGTALKPALEPITVARKPFKGSVANNVLKWGTGGINIDGCRVEGGERDARENNISWGIDRVGQENNIRGNKAVGTTTQGRFPANLIHDGSDEVVGLFPETGNSSRPNRLNNKVITPPWKGFSNDKKTKWKPAGLEHNDSGSAARFFYCAKASKKDRNEGCEGLEAKAVTSWHFKCKKCGKTYAEQKHKSGCQCEKPEIEQWTGDSKNNHPTVKPTKLMQYLVRLVTPKDGICLDPFMGSGSTAKACIKEGFNYIGIELEEKYVEIAQQRIKEVAGRKAEGDVLFVHKKTGKLRTMTLQDFGIPPSTKVTGYP